MSRLQASTCLVAFGIWASAFAQTSTASDQTLVAGDVVFAAQVVSTKGDKIAEIDDLVVNVHTGRIVDAVVGVGFGQSRSVSFQELTWNAEKAQFELDSTKEQLDSLAQFRLEDLTSGNLEAGLKAAARSHTTIGGAGRVDQPSEPLKPGDNRGQAPAAESGGGQPSDPAGEARDYKPPMRGNNQPQTDDGQDGQPMAIVDASGNFAWLMANQRAETIQGTIVEIRPDTVTAVGETSCSVVVLAGGQDHVVYLAPSSYLSEQRADMQQGDAVTVTTYRVFDRNGQRAYIATSVQRPDQPTIELRGQGGVAVWETAQPGSTGTASRTSVTQPATAQDGNAEEPLYRLASSLGKGTVFARGEEFGQMSELVFDLGNGTLVIGIVSRGGLLGIGATRSPIPVCALELNEEDGSFAVDLSTAELEQAPILTESGIVELGDVAFMEKLHATYKTASKTQDGSLRVEAPQEGGFK